MIEPHHLPEPPLPKRGRPAKNRPAFLGPIKAYHAIPDAVACVSCERLFIPWKGARYCSMTCFLELNSVYPNAPEGQQVKPREKKRRRLNGACRAPGGSPGSPRP